MHAPLRTIFTSTSSRRPRLRGRLTWRFFLVLSLILSASTISAYLFVIITSASKGDSISIPSILVFALAWFIIDAIFSAVLMRLRRADVVLALILGVATQFYLMLAALTYTMLRSIDDRFVGRVGERDFAVQILMVSLAFAPSIVVTLLCSILWFRNANSQPSELTRLVQ